MEKLLILKSDNSKTRRYYIYRITHKKSGKVYIGRGSGRRIKDYQTDSLCGIIDQPKIYNAIRKHGKNAFLFEIIIDNLTLEESYRYEYIQVVVYNSVEEGYNCIYPNPNGEGCGQLSEETKLKISIARTGQKLSEQTKKKISNYMKNVSQEYKDNMSKSCSGSKNGNFGRRHSDWAKLQVSLANKGRPSKFKIIIPKEQLDENNILKTVIPLNLQKKKQISPWHIACNRLYHQQWSENKKNKNK